MEVLVGYFHSGNATQKQKQTKKLLSLEIFIYVTSCQRLIVLKTATDNQPKIILHACDRKQKQLTVPYKASCTQEML